MALLMMLTVAYFAHKNGWGGDIRFVWSRFGKALIETGRDRLAAAATGACNGGRRRAAQLTVAVALVLLFAADRIFRFQAVLPIMTPVLLIGGMTTGVFTPTEGAIAACVWAMVLGLAWYRTLNLATRQGLPGHRGDHLDGDVHRRRGVVDLRLDAHRHRRHAPSPSGCWRSPSALAVPAAGQPADAVRRLLPEPTTRRSRSSCPSCCRSRGSSASIRCTSAS